jgi:MFS transporter, ACS family, glucarate transporter
MPLFRRPVRIRWWIFAFTLAFPMLSYIQRLGVQDLAATVMPDLHLSQLQIGWIATAFTAAYAVAQLPGGVFCQRVGARWTLVVVGILGFIATLAFPLASMLLAGTVLFVTLLCAQALLGISQGPLFSAALAVVETWIPARQWAMAGGLQTAGMNFGGAVTPLLVTLLSGSFGWKGSLLWIALLLTLSYLCMNYVYYLLSFWAYLYLLQVRHFSGIEGGLAGAVPWIGAGLGAAAGGFISDALARRIGVRWGYRLVPLLALPVAGLMLLVTLWVATPYLAVAALTAVFFLIEITEGVFGAAIMRVARADIATAWGIANTGGNVGGMITQPLVGFLTNSGAWGGAFITGTVFASVAGGLWIFIDPERRAEVD